MSGNVWEWEDSCNASSGASDQCRLEGGRTGSTGLPTCDAQPAM